MAAYLHVDVFDEMITLQVDASGRVRSPFIRTLATAQDI